MQFAQTLDSRVKLGDNDSNGVGVVVFVHLPPIDN